MLVLMSEFQAVDKGKVNCFQIGLLCCEDRTEDPLQLLETFLETREVVQNCGLYWIYLSVPMHMNHIDSTQSIVFLFIMNHIRLIAQFKKLKVIYLLCRHAPLNPSNADLHTVTRIWNIPYENVNYQGVDKAAKQLAFYCNELGKFA